MKSADCVYNIPLIILHLWRLDHNIVDDSTVNKCSTYASVLLKCAELTNINTSHTLTTGCWPSSTMERGLVKCGQVGVG